MMVMGKKFCTIGIDIVFFQVLTMLTSTLIRRSVVSVANSEGETENSYAYNPFGKVLHQTERVRNIYLYIGKLGVICDEELENMFMMRARHYDAQHGRYISLDPAG